MHIHVHTCPMIIPKPQARTSPQHSQAGSSACPHPPGLHVGAPRRQTAARPTEPRACPEQRGKARPGAGQTKLASNGAQH